ncbi:hypothetical protein BDR26DRAFT_69658 [Obelidium mucronatum]|nr:hypothetical protein BDR26DRAFT_69658 [Obelidium mucronatum]
MEVSDDSYPIEEERPRLSLGDVKESDFDTYEEYLSAQDSASLLIVERESMSETPCVPDEAENLENGFIGQETLELIEEEDVDVGMDVEDVVAEYAVNETSLDDVEAEQTGSANDEVVNKGKEPAQVSPKPKKMTSITQWPKVKAMARNFEAVAEATVQKPSAPASRKPVTTKKPSVSTIPKSSSVTRPTLSSSSKSTTTESSKPSVKASQSSSSSPAKPLSAKTSVTTKRVIRCLHPSVVSQADSLLPFFQSPHRARDYAGHCRIPVPCGQSFFHKIQCHTITHTIAFHFKENNFNQSPTGSSNLGRVCHNQGFDIYQVLEQRSCS